MGDTKPSESSSSSSTSRTTVQLDRKTFIRKLELLYDHFQGSKKDNSLWKEADVVVLGLGAPDTDNPYKKSSALHHWFLSYEFAETVMVFCKKDLYILTSSKKATMLETLQKGLQEEGSAVAIRFLTINKADGNKENFDAIFAAIQKSNNGKNVGTIAKDRLLGDFGKQWEEALASSGLHLVDVTTGFSALLSVKDVQEQKLVRTSADLTVKVMRDHFIPLMETIIDDGQQISHDTIAEQINVLLENATKVNPKLTNDSAESSYIPIVQSGGQYDLRLSAVNNNEPLHFGTILCSLGARYKNYCTNVARSFFINPESEQEANYKLLLEVHQIVVKSLKPDVVIGKVYEKAMKHIEEKNPALAEHILKSCGYGIGIEVQEPNLSINPKNPKKILAGMVFNVMVGFQNVEPKTVPQDPKKKKYSMLLSDTVLVTDGEPEVLTKAIDKAFGNVSYWLDDESKQEAPEKKSKPKEPPSKVKQEKVDKRDEDKGAKKGNAQSNNKSTIEILDARLRERDQKQKSKDKKDFKDHQKELAKQKAEEAQLKAQLDEDIGAGTSTNRGPDHIAYPDPSYFPADASKNKIVVDNKRESILLPIYGYIVPFHVSTIKNASKNEDYLRINFVTPTAATVTSGQTNTVYVREVTFRIQDQRSLSMNLRMIKELRKRVMERDAEITTKKTLVTQDKLLVSKGRNPRLADVYIRPNIVGTRRSPGILEAHVNGLRFTTTKSVTVDILYKNIKHAFFQPAENEVIILIHFHLHNEIMLGKKKTKDIQFFSETAEASQHLDNARSVYDADEYEDEQRENELRIKLNKEFQNFIKKVDETMQVQGVDIEFDIPYRELGFHGVPGKANVFLQPTVHCLVSLVDTPFFVLTLNEIEICHFERVQFSLRNFDMVFVFKDFAKPVARISAIPMDSLDTIKEWLDSCNIKFYEGPTNLNWNRIMQTIRDDPKKFYEEGGWGFLETGSSDEEGEEDDGEEVESDFEPAGGDGDEETDDEEYDSGEDYSAEEEDEEEEEEEEEEEDEEDDEVEDDEEMDRRARKEDRKRKFDEDTRPKRKKKGNELYSDDEEAASDEEPKKKKKAPSSSK